METSKSTSEEYLQKVRKRRRGLQARALAALQGEILGEIRRSDMRQGGDLDLAHVSLRRTDEERVHVDRERNDAVLSVEIVDAAEELIDRSWLFAELNDLLQRSP